MSKTETSPKSSEPITLKLSKPMDSGDGDPVTALIFREPKGSDLEDLNLPPKFGDYLLLAGRITGQTPAFMRRLGATDAFSAVRIASDFMDDGQETGST